MGVGATIQPAVSVGGGCSMRAYTECHRRDAQSKAATTKRYTPSGAADLVFLAADWMSSDFAD